jgi:allantoicase
MALSEFVDLASQRVGGSVPFATDDFFASRENLVVDAPPVFDPDAFVATGKLMDGWESRRRRTPGHDWCLVRLGLRGRVRRVVVDTAFFTGNFPAECSIEVCDVSPLTPVAALESDATPWREVVPRSPLAGNTPNAFVLTDDAPVSHLRLRIFTDGGVARLRVLGEVAPPWDDVDATGELVDLGGVEHGGRVIETSDMFYGDAQNMLMPGRARNMGDGWETRRRRGPGNDWALVALGAVGRLSRIEVDTEHFKGNAPGEVMLEGCRVDSAADLARATWQPLLARTPVMTHTRHVFTAELGDPGPLSHVRIHIFPDGGLARLRLHGRTERAERLLLAVAAKGALSAAAREAELLAVCASRTWAAAVSARFPVVDAAALLRVADQVWRGLDRAAWLEAFAAHPRIGEQGGGAWSKEEQAGTVGAAVATRRALVEANRAYEARFGHIYLVCATGRTAAELLAILEARMTNDPDTELAVAAEEQRKITRLRLLKWLLP